MNLKNNKIKYLLIAVVLIAVFALFFYQKEKKQKDDIYIYFTGDIHCAIDENIGYSSLSAFVKQQRQEHPYVTLIDLGDFLQDNAKNSNEDSSISSLTKGEAIIDIMNIVGYDVVTIGNHEFDFGINRMASNLGKLNAELTVCNARYKGNLINPLEKAKDYIIKDYDGTKVAYIGVISPETSYKVDKEIMRDEQGCELFYFFDGVNGKYLYERVQNIIDIAKKEADYVVLMSHLGIDNVIGCSSIDLIENTSGIDVLLDSHSHIVEEKKTYKNKLGKDVYYSSTGKSLENIGKLVLKKDHSIDLSLIKGYDKKRKPIAMDDDKEVLKVLSDLHDELYGMND